jgi:acyl carrier protein
MERDQIIAEIQPIFRDVLDQPNLMLTPASNASNVEDWDSLAHVTLVAAVERRFKVKFTLADLQGLKNIVALAVIVVFLRMGTAGKLTPVTRIDRL